MTTLAILLTVAMTAILFRDFNYHRMFIFYAWLFSIIFLSFGRMVHAQVQWQVQSRGSARIVCC
ncbi:MAG: hypothetical protein R2873_15775 [Caldilineaceae bacterium]